MYRHVANGRCWLPVASNGNEQGNKNRHSDGNNKRRRGFGVTTNRRGIWKGISIPGK